MGQERDLGAERREVVHLMARDHHRRALGGQVTENPVDMPLGCRVEAVGRLVEHQQTRLGQQSGRQAEPLTHAQGEAAHPVVGHVEETDLLQGVVDLGAPLGPVAVQPRERDQVLPGGQRGVETGSVDETAHAPGHPEHPVDRRAQDLETALVGDGEPEQQPQEGGLPGPVRPHETVDLPPRDVEVDAVERYDVAEVLGRAPGPDRERAALLRLQIVERARR